MQIANVVLNDFTRDNRVLKIAQSLTDSGHEVTVVALHKVGLPLEEERGNWRVNRTRTASAALPRGTLFGAVRLAELALKLVWKWRKVDAWHCNDIEAFALGWCAQRINPRLKLVYDCHEFEAERNGKPAIERRLVGWLERVMIRKAEAVITVSPSIAEAYRQRYADYGIPEVHLVRNIPEREPEDSANATSDASPDHFRARFGIPKEDFIALYQGAFIYNRGLETVLEAMESLEGTGIHLVLMGYGRLQNLVDEAAQRWPHIHVHPAVPYEEVLAYTRSADVGLVSVKPTCLSYLYCLPNKLFEYILSGVPVLSNDLPDCRALIEECGVGAVVKDDNPRGWRQALVELRENGTHDFQSGLESAPSRLSWNQEKAKLVAIYAHMAH